MSELKNKIQEYIDKGELLLSLVASNSKDKEKISKVKLRPLMKKEELIYQAESFVGTKAFHENMEPTELPAYVEGLTEDFRQIEIETRTQRLVVLVSKKGKQTINVKNKPQVQSVNKAELSHNKTKQYVLPEGEPVPFLIELGVQTAEGKIIKAKYDKFRQINRYLEFVRDILPNLPKDRTLTILDFGCGKSYLTFALYHYLKVMNHYDIRVIGLDLKEDVIEKCNALSRKYGYDDLTFHVGDISSFEGPVEVDMVVTLHACDVATDYALEKAVKWNAKVIFSVPCCQHELNKQIKCKELEPLLKYGLIKERMAALMTDAIRANLLEAQGYDTQILEFIDMEHTPKNILIRAVKKQRMRYRAGVHQGVNAIDQVCDFLNVNPTLRNLLDTNIQSEADLNEESNH